MLFTATRLWLCIKYCAARLLHKVTKGSVSPTRIRSGYGPRLYSTFVFTDMLYSVTHSAVPERSFEYIHCQIRIPIQRCYVLSLYEYYASNFFFSFIVLKKLKFV